MSRLHALAINAEGFAFNPLTGECFRLNASGEAVIAAMRRGDTDETIADTFVREHGIPFGRALADVLEFRTQLANCRLLD